jgi:hypothetical protein
MSLSSLSKQVPPSLPALVSRKRRALSGPVRDGSRAQPACLASEGTAPSGPSEPTRRMSQRSSQPRPEYDGPYERKTNPGEK